MRWPLPLILLLAALSRPTARERVDAALARIAELDARGPSLHAMIELNPDAVRIADRLDRGRPGASPLWGDPIVVKDNLDTADAMQTSAGSLGLVGAPAPRDSTVVARLRRAGLVLLGKSNLSEWANIRSSHSTSGWSARGGQTRNPYALARTPCGSSAGSAVAVAAGYVTVAIGTETDGSIVCPSSVNGIVGLKPTLGLVSRAGIVPISHDQDTAGPMAIDVRHAAELLAAVAGADPRDPAASGADAHVVDYVAALDAGALRGARLGVVRKLAGFDPAVDRLLDAAVSVLRRAGATVIEVQIPHLGELGDDELTVLTWDLKTDLTAYLATRPGVPIRSLADAIAFDERHAAEEMPWFGQELFEKAQAAGSLGDATYLAALSRIRKLAGPEGLEAALARDRLDALLAPTTGVATLVDYLNGDAIAGSASQLPAIAGTPHLTVPMGTIHGLPVGLSFMGARWSEARLLALGYAWERLAPPRAPPAFPIDVIPPNGR